MAKINPFENKRLRGITETKSFSDPAQPGKPLEITLSSKPGSTTPLAIEANSGRLAQRYLDPMAIGIFHDGEEIKLTGPVIYCIAAIQTLDSGSAEEKYSFEEWAVIQHTMPSAFTEIVNWASDLAGQYERDLPEDGSTPLPNASKVE